MKRITLTEKISLVVVTIGLIFQFMNDDLFGNDPIPEITKYHQILFWGGILIWAFGYMKRSTKQKQDNHKTNSN